LNAGKLTSATYILWSRYVCSFHRTSRTTQFLHFQKGEPVHSDLKWPYTSALHLWLHNHRHLLLAVPYLFTKNPSCVHKTGLAIIGNSDPDGGLLQVFLPLRGEVVENVVVCMKNPSGRYELEEVISSYLDWHFSRVKASKGENFRFQLPSRCYSRDLLVILYPETHSGRLQLLMLGVASHIIRPVRHASLINRPLLCCILCSFQHWNRLGLPANASHTTL
jgi:hypothetical protein